MQYKKASDMLKGCKIDIKTLYNKELTASSKIKYTLFSIFGPYMHSRIASMLHKKLR